MNMFSSRNLPWTLVISGLLLNGLDILTAKPDGSGGVVFGSNGFLRGVDAALPDMNLPGTEIPVNLGGYLVASGLVWLGIREVT